MDAQEQLTQQLATDVHEVAQAVKRAEPQLKEIVEALPGIALRNRLMWAVMLFVGTAIFSAISWITTRHISHQIQAAAAPALELRQAAQAAVLDLAPSIRPAGRIASSGERMGWPTVAALNGRLTQLKRDGVIDPQHPSIRALDRDVACRQQPEACRAP